MLRYNIYYNNEKLNKYPISGDEIEKIIKQKYIQKTIIALDYLEYIMLSIQTSLFN